MQYDLENTKYHGLNTKNAMVQSLSVEYIHTTCITHIGGLAEKD